MRATIVLVALVIAGCMEVDAPDQEDSITMPDGQPADPGAVNVTWSPTFPRAGAPVVFEAVVDGGEVHWSAAGQVVGGNPATFTFAEPGTVTVTMAWTQGGMLQDRQDLSVVVLNPALDAATANGTVEELSPEVETLRAALASGAATVEATKVAFLAPLSGPDTAEFDLVMSPSELLAQTWSEIDGVPVVPSWVEVYEGHVAGAPDQLARLTLAPDWAMGYIRVGDVPYMVRIGMDGNFPAGVEVPFSRLVPPGPFDPDGGMHPHDCLSAVPTHATPVVELGRSGMDTITVDIILDADAEFLSIFGNHAFPLMVGYLSEVDAIYDHEMGIRFHITGLHLSTDPQKYPAPADAAPLGAMADYWTDRHVERDSVHLYTGHPSSYAQANCIGGAGDPALAYTFTTVQWASYTGESALRHTQTFAHELGHIYNAHHHYSSVEGELQTIMAQGANKYAPVFSTLTKSIIRGWAEDHTQG